MSVFAFAGTLTRPAPAYREANGRGLASLRFEPSTGQLSLIAERNDIDDASWLTLDLRRRRLYAICDVRDSDQSWVIAFRIDDDGRLIELSRQPTGGQTGCHASLSPDGRLLLVANYNAVVPAGVPDGSLAVFPITEGASARERATHATKAQDQTPDARSGRTPIASCRRRTAALPMLPISDWTASLSMNLPRTVA